MRITEVTINNFKRFDTFHAQLGQLDCLVGANNTGKTTLLQALALFDFCVQHCLERPNGGGLRLRARTIAPEDFYVLPVTGPLDLWHDRKALAGGKQRRISVEVRTTDGIEATATVKLDYNRFGVSLRTSDQAPEALDHLRRCRMAYLPVFSMFLPHEERRLKAAIEDELARGRVHSVIRNLMLELKEQGRDAELSAILRRAFAELRDLEIEFDEVTDRYIEIAYKEQGRPKSLDIFSAGSGFQQFLYLFGFILARQPQVILLDEPDVHLHGSLQAAFLDELKRMVQLEGKQVLLATHSRELIARIGVEHILSLEAEPRRLKVAFDIYDTLDRLGSVDPTVIALIQAYRRVVLVEGPSDRDLLDVLCSTALGQEVWQQIRRRVAFLTVGGNPSKQPMDRQRRLLQQAMAMQGEALEAFAIADCDYHPDRAALLNSLNAEHLQWHVWERAEIENYLLCLPALRRLAGATEDQATFDALDLDEEFDRLVEESRGPANDRLVKSHLEWARAREQGMDPSTASSQARQFIEAKWTGHRLGLADAKDVVLPGLKRWLQQNHLGQFSDLGLAHAMTREDLPQEVLDVAARLAAFAGVRARTT
ncbi:MAG: ATP-binding protein [Armatimonadetes bacterium]|nr:ATP-binding protein [Armatimonadota bacterium]